MEDSGQRHSERDSQQSPGQYYVGYTYTAFVSSTRLSIGLSMVGEGIVLGYTYTASVSSTLPPCLLMSELSGHWNMSTNECDHVMSSSSDLLATTAADTTPKCRREQVEHAAETNEHERVGMGSSLGYALYICCGRFAR